MNKIIKHQPFQFLNLFHSPPWHNRSIRNKRLGKAKQWCEKVILKRMFRKCPLNTHSWSYFKLVQTFLENCDNSLKKTELLYDSVVLLLHIYLRNQNYHVKIIGIICNIITKTWSPLQYPSTDEWILEIVVYLLTSPHSL